MDICAQGRGVRVCVLLFLELAGVYQVGRVHRQSEKEEGR